MTGVHDKVHLDDLYQEIILDHYKHPRNFHALSDAEALVDEENPTCGDQIKLTATVEGGRIEDVKYEARGCAISMASSSMMSELMSGISIDEARDKIDAFIGMMKGRTGGWEDDDDASDVVALEGVKQYPMRIKCATMSWHAMAHALDKLTGNNSG